MRTLRKLLWVCILSLISGGAFADGAPLVKSSIARGKEATVLSPKEMGRLDAVRKGNTTRDVTLVVIDKNAFLSTVISITSPSGKVGKFTLLKSYVRDELHSWIGLGERPGDTANFVLSDGGGLSGHVDMGHERFVFESLNSTTQAMVDVDTSIGYEHIGSEPKK